MTPGSCRSADPIGWRIPMLPVAAAPKPRLTPFLSPNVPLPLGLFPQHPSPHGVAGRGVASAVGVAETIGKDEAAIGVGSMGIEWREWGAPAIGRAGVEGWS